MRYMGFAAGAVCVSTLFAMGCGKATEVAQEKAIEAALSQDGVDADVDLAQDGSTMSFSAKTGAGDAAFTVGENVGMPEGFPKDIPTLEGWKVQMAQTETSSHMFHVMASTAKSLDEVAAHYKKEMTAQGWTEASTMNAPGMMATMQFTKDKRTATVSITASDGSDTMVNITTMEEK